MEGVETKSKSSRGQNLNRVWERCNFASTPSTVAFHLGVTFTIVILCTFQVFFNASLVMSGMLQEIMKELSSKNEKVVTQTVRDTLKMLFYYVPITPLACPTYLLSLRR